MKFKTFKNVFFACYLPLTTILSSPSRVATVMVLTLASMHNFPKFTVTQ